MKPAWPEGSDVPEHAHFASLFGVTKSTHNAPEDEVAEPEDDHHKGEVDQFAHLDCQLRNWDSNFPKGRRVDPHQPTHRPGNSGENKRREDVDPPKRCHHHHHRNRRDDAKYHCDLSVAFAEKETRWVATSAATSISSGQGRQDQPENACRPN